MKATGVYIAGTVGGIAQMIWTITVFGAGCVFGYKAHKKYADDMKATRTDKKACDGNCKGECECQK